MQAFRPADATAGRLTRNTYTHRDNQCGHMPALFCDNAHMATLLSIVESASHPNLTGTYQQLGISETKLNSMRKALAILKSQPFNYIVAEFFYGYGNNYAGVNISNLDVMLYSLQKYSPNTRVIVLVDKSEYEYVDKLNEIFPIYAVLQYPVGEADIKQLFSVG